MIIVTGGAGFIGSNLVAGLEKRGHNDIIICDSLGNSEKWRNIAKRELAEFVPSHELFGFLDNHASEISTIFHFGGVSSTTETDADLMVTQNFQMPVRLWRWCCRHGTRFIYASSAVTYGDGAHGFDDDFSSDTLETYRPLSAFGWSKHAFDRWVARVVRTGRVRPPQWVGLKFFNAYGPNEYHKGNQRSVVTQIYDQIQRGDPATLFKSHHPDYQDGMQLRDFIWVGDCVDVLLWLYDNHSVNGVFNLGSGKARSFVDLAHAVYAAIGQAPRLQFIDTPDHIRAKYQYFTEAKMDRLRKAGYSKPFTSLEDGVAAYVRDFLSQPDPYK
jgi:ADP-L-glycero-D-manno-heptose 6-epimerase